MEALEEMACSRQLLDYLLITRVAVAAPLLALRDKEVWVVAEAQRMEALE
jgi:hypothetical protein